MLVDFSQKLTALNGKTAYEPRKPAVANELDKWLNNLNNAFIENDTTTVDNLLNKLSGMEPPKELTLRTVCAEALLDVQEDSRTMTEVDKLQLDILARKIYFSAEPIEIDQSEVRLILRRLNKNIYGSNPVIFRQVNDALKKVKNG